MQVDYEQIHSICVETHLCDKPEHFYLYKCFSWFWFQISIVLTVLERKHASPACALVSVRECNNVDMCPGLVMWSSVTCSFIFTGERNTTYVLDWELIVSHRTKPKRRAVPPGCSRCTPLSAHIRTALYNLMLPGLFEVFLLQVPCSNWWKIYIQLLQIPNSSKDFFFFFLRKRWQLSPCAPASEYFLHREWVFPGS